VIAMHDEHSIELAVAMGQAPHQIDAMGYLDSLSFFKAWAKHRRSDAAFEASLHGRELK